MDGIEDIYKFSRGCFYIASAIGIGVLLFILSMRWLNIDIFHLLPPCFFYQGTHYYCFGCGGTRAVRALLEGKILTSIYYHPFVIYAVSIYGAFIISHLVSIIFKIGKGMIFRPVYCYIAMGIIILQGLLKNYLVFRYGFVL